MLLVIFPFLISANDANSRLYKSSLDYMQDFHGLSTKNVDCQPPANSIEISNCFNKETPISQKIIYGCSGSYKSRLEAKNSRIIIYSCQFTEIQSNKQGGAIYLFWESDRLEAHLLENTIIEDCIFQDCSGSFGGAVYLSFGNYNNDNYVLITIANTLFYHNTATEYGGAIDYRGPYIIIDNCKFIRNSALKQGNDLYYEFSKFYDKTDYTNEPIQGIYITNSLFECLVYKNTKHMIQIRGERIDCEFRNNTIAIKDTDSNPDDFYAIYLEDSGFFGSQTFSDNVMWLFDEATLTNSKMREEYPNFVKSFVSSPSSCNQCQTPPETFQDISYGFTHIKNYSNIYGCHGEYDHRMYAEQSRFMIYSCKFNSIESTESGGAIMIVVNNLLNDDVKGNFIIEDSVFDKCKTSSESGGGGAFFINFDKNNQEKFNGECIINNCVFENCAAKNQGGSVRICLYQFYVNVRITNTIFKQNKANNFGGAIIFFYSDEQSGSQGSIIIKSESIIENCSFENCIADLGGVVYVDMKQLFVPFRITNTTFKENSATKTGGGLYMRVSNFTLENSHFIDNYSPEASDIYLIYFTTDAFSIIDLDSNDFVQKNILITKNEFKQSLDDGISLMIHLTCTGDSPNDVHFSKNNIEITGKNMESTNFHAIGFDIIPYNKDFSENSISPCNEEIAIKDNKIVFLDCFPNCAYNPTPSHDFSDSVDFTKSSFFSATADFSNTLYFTGSADFTKTYAFSDSADFTHSFSFTNPLIEESSLLESSEESSLLESSEESSKESSEKSSEESSEDSSLLESSEESSLLESSSPIQKQDESSPLDESPPVKTQDELSSAKTNQLDLPVASPDQKPFQPIFSQIIQSSSSYRDPGAINIVGNNGKKNKGLSVWMIVLIALAVVLVIVIIIIIVIVKRHKESEENVEKEIETMEEMTKNEAETEFSNPLYVPRQNADDPFEIFDENKYD